MNERKVVVMNKHNEGNLNEVAISLAALKQSDKGAEVVVLTADNQVGWFSVENVVGTRGCKGGTTLTLRDLASGDLTTVFVNNSLPEGVVRVRRVSAGVNARTLRNMEAARIKAAAEAAAKTTIIQPVGEFENILDVPLVEEGEEGQVETQTVETPVEAVEMPPALEVVAEVAESTDVAQTNTPITEEAAEPEAAVA